MECIPSSYVKVTGAFYIGAIQDKIPNKTFGQHFKGQRPVLYQCFIAEQLQFNFYYSLVFSPVRY